MKTKLDESELERGLRGVLDGVRGGQPVVIERDGRAIAVIVPPELMLGITWQDPAEALRGIPRLDEDFARDLAEIRAAQPPVRILEWPD